MHYPHAQLQVADMHVVRTSISRDSNVGDHNVQGFIQLGLTGGKPAFVLLYCAFNLDKSLKNLIHCSLQSGEILHFCVYLIL